MSPFSVRSGIHQIIRMFSPTSWEKQIMVFDVKAKQPENPEIETNMTNEILNRAACADSQDLWGCVYDFAQNRYIFVENANSSSFEDLIASRDIVVGFDSISRGQRLILANWGISIPPEKHFDLQVEIMRAAVLLSPHSPADPALFSLRACCTANFLGYRQPADSRDISRAGEQGRKDFVLEQCRATVKHIKDLLAICIDPKQSFVNPARPNQFLTILSPAAWLEQGDDIRAA